MVLSSDAPFLEQIIHTVLKKMFDPALANSLPTIIKNGYHSGNIHIEPCDVITLNDQNRLPLPQPVPNGCGQSEDTCGNARISFVESKLSGLHTIKNKNAIKITGEQSRISADFSLTAVQMKGAFLCSQPCANREAIYDGVYTCNIEDIGMEITLALIIPASSKDSMRVQLQAIVVEFAPDKMKISIAPTGGQEPTGKERFNWRWATSLLNSNVGTDDTPSMKQHLKNEIIAAIPKEKQLTSMLEHVINQFLAEL